MSSDQAARVTVGRVVKPHGIRGEVAVEPLTDVPGRFAPGASVTAADAASTAAGAREEPVPLTVAGSRPHQGRLLVAFEEIADRDAAEGLRGAELRADPVDEETFPTYFVHELVGAPVVREDGRRIGVVDEVLGVPATAGYELLEVTRPDGSTLLLPDPDELVEAVPDGDGLRLVVTDPPEGLLEE